MLVTMASSTQAERQDANQEPWFLKSSFPVFLPSHTALTASQADFETYLQTVKKSVSIANDEALQQDGSKDGEAEAIDTETDSTLHFDISTSADVREDLGKMNLEEEYSFENPTSDNPFMKSLLSYQDGDFQRSIAKQIEERKNMLRTENLDIAYRSTTDPLLDLFTELEDVVSGPRLLELLEGAWKANAEMTLKIIFNARSIHLGKASRQTFYRCAGWLAKNHPQTLLANLAWLSRPVVQKKVEKEKNGDGKEEEEEFEMVFAEDEVDENDPARFDVRNGVAHGYWKDLLNILALYVNGKLDVLANPRDILNIEQEKDKSNWPKSREEAQTMRREKRDARHETAVKIFQEDPVYRALHLTVTRLFAAQLTQDLAALCGKDAAAKRRISLCAKWAPSSERFHDKHTFVVSSIAEVLHPASELAQFAGRDAASEEQRQLYLRHAREAYRKDVSALRKHLEVVERDIAANTYKNIKYDRVPSIAMNNYASLFAAKDTKRFIEYIDKVAEGKARISGATLLPSKLIKAVRETNWNPNALAAFEDDDEDDDYDEKTSGKKTTIPAKRKKGAEKTLVNAKIAEMKLKVLEGQWNTLVQRIKDSGTLSNSIAVADVSGSMQDPVFPDGTCPMDSSIGLALLVAEVTQPPFDGGFITFSDRPKMQCVDTPGWTLKQKVDCVLRSPWRMSTDFEAVFAELILPMAITHKLKQEDMVKRVFVFSDMQFNQATRLAQADLDTSFERIRNKYSDAGYEMPELVFWNLAGGRAGYLAGATGGDPVAPKPVTALEGDTALVSGYSQGILKVFLEGGSFDEEVVEEEEGEEGEENEEGMVNIGKDGEVVVDPVKKKQKLDPLGVVRKAVGHRAYSMLLVVD